MGKREQDPSGLSSRLNNALQREPYSVLIVISILSPVCRFFLRRDTSKLVTAFILCLH